MREREASDQSELAGVIRKRYLSFPGVSTIRSTLGVANASAAWTSRRLPLLEQVYQRWALSGVSSWHTLSPRPRFWLSKIRRGFSASPNENAPIEEARLLKRTDQRPAKMVGSLIGITAQAALQKAKPVQSMGEHMGTRSNLPGRVKHVEHQRSSPVERPEQQSALAMGRTTMVHSPSEASSVPVGSAARSTVVSRDKGRTQAVDRPLNPNVEVSPLREVFRLPTIRSAGVMKSRGALKQIRRHQWSGSGPDPRAELAKTPGVAPTVLSMGSPGMRVAQGEQGAQGQSGSVTVGAEKVQQVESGRRNLVGTAILRSNLTAKSMDTGLARPLWKAGDLSGPGPGRADRLDLKAIPTWKPQLPVAVFQAVTHTKRGRTGDITSRAGLTIDGDSGEALQYRKVKSRGGWSNRQIEQQYYSWASGQGLVLSRADSHLGNRVKKEHLTTDRLGESGGSVTEDLASQILSRHLSSTTQQASSWTAAAGRTFDRYGADGGVLRRLQGRLHPKTTFIQTAFGISTQPVVTSTPASPSMLEDQRQAVAWDMTDGGKVRDTQAPVSEFSGSQRSLAVQRAPWGSARTGKEQGDPFFPILRRMKTTMPVPDRVNRIHARAENLTEPATIFLERAASPVSESPGAGGSTSAVAPTDETAPLARAPSSREQFDLEWLADEIYAILERRLVVERESLGL